MTWLRGWPALALVSLTLSVSLACDDEGDGGSGDAAGDAGRPADAARVADAGADSTVPDGAARGVADADLEANLIDRDAPPVVINPGAGQIGDAF